MNGKNIVSALEKVSMGTEEWIALDEIDERLLARDVCGRDFHGEPDGAGSSIKRRGAE